MTTNASKHLYILLIAFLLCRAPKRAEEDDPSMAALASRLVQTVPF
jgi:hypothetical protein